MIATLHLFPDLNAALIELLSSLTSDDWHKPTVHASRDVKDLAAHLLDTTLRRLSMQRDHFFQPGPPIQSYEDLVALIQTLNRQWIDATKRLSPHVLIKMIEQADSEMLTLLQSLAPEEPALFSVAWAGEATSTNWFDIAREYTEKWHHQQQIRDAVAKPGLADRAFMAPVLETFMLGAPHAYRSTVASEGTTLLIEVTGESGGKWWLQRDLTRWKFTTEPHGADATVAIDQDLAWRLWTKGLSPSHAREAAKMTGPENLCLPIFEMVSIMA